MIRPHATRTVELIALLDKLEMWIPYANDAGHQEELIRQRDEARAELDAIAPAGKGSKRLHDFENEVDAHVGHRVRTARFESNRMQRDLGEAVGLDQRVLSKIEHGHRSVTVPELVRIAIELRRPLLYFLEPAAPEAVVTGWERSGAQAGGTGKAPNTGRELPRAGEEPS